MCETQTECRVRTCEKVCTAGPVGWKPVEMAMDIAGAQKNKEASTVTNETSLSSTDMAKVQVGNCQSAR